MSAISPRRTQAEINEELLSVDHLKDSLGKRTARGGVIVIAAQMARAVIQLVTTFFLSRLLAPEDFGVIAIGYTVLTFITMFTELSLSTAAVQTQRLTQNTASAIFGINIATTLVAFVIAAISTPLTVWLFQDTRLPAVIVGLAICAPINALGSQHSALMTRNMRWMLLQTLSLSSMIVGSIAAVLAAWLLDIGYWTLVVQAIVSAIVGVVLTWMAFPWRPSIVTDWSGAKKALRFSLNLTGVTMMGFLHRQTDNILIGWRWGAGELGYYSRAYTLLMMPLNLVTGPLSSAIIPAMSRLQDAPDRWRKAYLDGLIVVTLIGGAMTALLFGSSPVIIGVVFGPGWDESEKIFSLLVIAMLSATPLNTIFWIYVSTGRTNRMLHWSLMAAPFYVASFIVGLPYGATGVAASYGTAQIIAFVPGLWMATRGTNISMRDVFAATLPAILSTILVGSTLRYVVEHVSLPLAIIASVGAAIIHVGLMTLLVWHWPPYRRVRDRAHAMVTPILDRLGYKPTGL